MPRKNIVAFLFLLLIQRQINSLFEKRVREIDANFCYRNKSIPPLKKKAREISSDVCYRNKSIPSLKRGG